ncbi:MAG: multiple sugar transport system substrate-binding protein, partial [Pseudonocardiales bacterium]|nr:multiple sugar transport system substrate-binding protein [Pseudonocardiales bacterium]
LKALPRAVQYPSSTEWAAVKTQVQQTIGTAVSSDPKKVLSTIQQTAKKGG